MAAMGEGADQPTLQSYANDGPVEAAIAEQQQRQGADAKALSCC